MGSVLANFLPLALGAIAPVMIALIVMLLGTPDGLRKASAFILGKMAAYAVIIILLLTFVHNIDDSGGDDTQSTAILMLKSVLGGLFLVMAAKTFFTDEDPDAPPSKLQVKLQTMGILPTFLIGFGLSFIQLRFVLLVMAGVGIIRDAEMGTVVRGFGQSFPDSCNDLADADSELACISVWAIAVIRSWDR